MKRCWGEAGLPYGDELDVRGINRCYVSELNTKRIVSKEMRALFSAQTGAETKEIVTGIRGHWPSFDLALYTKQMREKYQRFDLSAMTRPEDEQFDRVLLGDIFVPQDAREQVPERELSHEYARLAHLPEEDEALAKQSTRRVATGDPVVRRQAPVDRRPVRDILAEEKSKRIVILGDPGTGKTVLVRDLCLRALDALDRPVVGVEPWFSPFDGCLPLIIELRNYVAACRDGHCQSFLEYWHYLGKSETSGLNCVELAKYLQTEASLIVFDGLDEVNERRQRAKVIDEIIGFAVAHEQARIVLTSRIQGYRAERLRDAGFHHATLEEFSDTQIELFTRGWFARAFPAHPADAAQRRKRVADALEGSSPLRALAGNPLLLTLIAIVARNQELPRERARLYEHALGVLVHNWDVTGKYMETRDLPSGFQDRRNKLDLLRWVAWRMAEDEQRLVSNVISGEHLEETIREYLESESWQLPPKESRPVASAILKQLHERNFVLCLQGANLYGFVHRTFLEYMIAEEYQIRLEKLGKLTLDELIEIFRSRAVDERWREILRLICGLVGEPSAARLIEAILDVKGDDKQNTEAAVLALECLAETGRPTLISAICDRVLEAVLALWTGGKEHRDIVDDYEHRVLPAFRILNDRWRAPDARAAWVGMRTKQLLGPWVEVHKGVPQSRHGRSVVTDAWLAAETTELLWGGTPGVRQQLSSLLDSSDADRRIALVTLAKLFPDRETQALLGDRAVNDPDARLRWEMLSLLAERFADCPETKTLLRNLAETDPDEERRIDALRLLRVQFGEDPETKALLRDRVANDPHRDVRGAALGSLAFYFKDDPETKALLCKQAVNDPHQDVRKWALFWMAMEFADDSETILLLRDRAVNDTDEEVRRWAVAFLARFETSAQALAIAMPLQRILALTKDLDDGPGSPGIDPLEPIDNARIGAVAEKLRLGRDEVIGLYRSLAAEYDLPLRFAEDVADAYPLSSLLPSPRY